MDRNRKKGEGFSGLGGPRLPAGGRGLPVGERFVPNRRHGDCTLFDSDDVAIAAGITDNLLTRAADVTLKERRRLVLMVREMPFHLGHLRTMTALAEMGAIIAPPVPGFYHRPRTVLDIVDHCVDRVLDLMGLPAADAQRWNPGEAKEQ